MGKDRRQFVCSPGCVTNEDIGNDPSFSGIAGAQRFRELRGTIAFHQIDRAASKTASGESCANQAGQVTSDSYHGVRFNAAPLEITAVALVSLGHQTAEFSQI